MAPEDGSRRGMTSVAVIIPCFNQGVFLNEAIESALRQTVTPNEIIVIDDGSTDDSAAVARAHPAVRYMRQENRGSAAARNAGLRLASSEFVIFLDADDLLLPGAVAAGVADLSAHPGCVMTFGRHGYVNMDGRERRPAHDRDVREPYLAMLEQNFVVVPAAAMFRRSAVEDVGGFDESMRTSEDYDLYLRLTRERPISRHDAEVALYRRHDANKTRDLDSERRHAIYALGKQLPNLRGNARQYAAYLAGRRNCSIWCAKQAAFRAYALAKQGRRMEAARSVISTVRNTPLRDVPAVVAALSGGFLRWRRRARRQSAP
jgi:glycosyltransferase involved in cell wall biosynthesis